jgi:Tfp pilus assembly protein PilX
MKAQMEMSVLVKLIIVLVVLVVVLLFFTGGFREIGTTKFTAVANNSTPVVDTNISGLITDMKGYF